jgi:hypothetical protein
MAYLSGCRGKGKHPFSRTTDVVLLRISRSKTPYCNAIYPQHFAAKVPSLKPDSSNKVNYSL